MPKTCPVCVHPRGRELTDRVLSGELTVNEAARELGISDAVMLYHIKNHIGRGGEDGEDLRTMLRDLLQKIHVLVDTGLTSGRINPNLIRELRGLAKDLMAMGGGLSDSADLENWIDELVSFLATELPDQCRDVVLKWLDEHPQPT